MQKVFNGLTCGAVCAALVVCAAFADSPRGATNMAARGRGTVASARMPSMPILPVMATGNMTIDSNDVDPTPSPTPTPTPTPTPDTPVDPTCPDGGIANSTYTVDNCMNDVLGCVNGGALPNGINSLFNEDLRNSIVNGMGLCLAQVEHCITTVRKNCQNVYETSADVWLDFNARKVQPEYYRFVLAQTGLTPTQAENTCLLLDRNTYGLSFDAVSDTDRVTSEYNQKVGAYNSQMNNSLTKANPMGVKVNDTGIDGNRGYYARWDAEKAQCLLRVAAYNKDTAIKNSWLFGAIGDETPAEVWQATGSTFTCNKDLFGFSLMNDTKTVAATAIPGGTLVGAGIGALAGHGDKQFDCQDESMREQLLVELQKNQKVGVLNQYLSTQISASDKTVSLDQCENIIELYYLWQMGKDAVKNCASSRITVTREELTTWTITNCPEGQDCSRLTQEDIDQYCNQNSDLCIKTSSAGECNFRELNLSQLQGRDIYCDATSKNCIDKNKFESEMNTLGTIFNSLSVLEGEKSNRLKTTLVGAGIGAGVGGTATAITAFVERNNINCRVADGLARVGFGKSHTIDRLRDFYVKWALNLPQTLAPTAVVTNCDNWQLTCAMFTDLDECKAAQFNYRPGNLSSTTLIQNPCTTSGSACIANLGTAQANGVCLANPVTPDINIPSAKNCAEWTGVCENIKKAADCNNAKVIYTPKSMQVANACKFDTASRNCRVNKDKAKLYLNTDTCPEHFEPAQY